MTREQIHRVLDIVLDGNGLTDRQKSTTGNLPTLFFSFSGHVSKVEVDLHADGWYPYADREKFEFATDMEITDEQIDALKRAVNKAWEGKETGIAIKEEERRNT